VVTVRFEGAADPAAEWRQVLAAHERVRVQGATSGACRLRGQVTPPRIATPAPTIVVSVGIPPPRET
jgi:hypothetical protein